MNSTNTELWTTRALLEWVNDRFEKHNIDSPRLIAEMLLSHVLGGPRIDLYANVDRIASEDELETLRSFVQRTLQHEPVQYIVGKVWFFGAEFNVNASTLIPRTCTETIVEQAVRHCELGDPAHTHRIADIGTGSGCIAITIANSLPNCTIVATDISKDAIELARENAALHGVDDQISFSCGNCTTPLTSLEPFDVICSNPPYIPDHEFSGLDPNVREWEPHIALSGGEDGLDVIRPIIESAPNYMAEGGLLLLEIATSNKDQVLKLAQSCSMLTDAMILKDQFGDNRFLRAVRQVCDGSGPLE